MMEIKSNSNDEHLTDPKPRRSLRVQSSKKLGGNNLPQLPTRTKPRRRQSWRNLPDLPLDIKLNIISRFPVKSLIRCKSLSKAFNNLISEPPFSQLCLTNRSNYSCLLCVDESKSPSLHLLEFDQTDNDNTPKRKRKSISKVAIFNLDRLPGGTCGAPAGGCFSIWGNCNGLFCLLKVESGLYNLFVTNPVLGQFIQLPEPAVYCRNIMLYLAYGIGHCQFTNRYKVLRIITKCFGGSKCQSESQIFTIGSDKKWRSLSDVNVPYNMKWGRFSPNPQSPMVALHSALHWVVQPVPIITSTTTNLDTNFGRGTMCICAFDMTEEKVTALPLPQLVAAHPPFYGRLTVLFGKLCLWRIHCGSEFWVMDDYGIQGSWTKQFVLKFATIPYNIKSRSLMPQLGVSQGVIVITDGYQEILYDFSKEKCLRVIHQSEDPYYSIPFVPSFVSLKNLVQG